MKILVINAGSSSLKYQLIDMETEAVMAKGLCERIGIEVWREIAESPSTRFWVSEERAAIVIARVIKGDTLSYMRPLRREMFMEIYRRVLDIKSVRQELSLRACCAKAVCTPAPKFYMTPLSVRQTIYKIKRKCLEEAKKRRRFFF